MNTRRFVCYFLISLLMLSFTACTPSVNIFNQPASTTAGNSTSNNSVVDTSTKDIVSFSVMDRSAAIVGTGISVTLPYGTSLSSLTPTMVHTGASVSPASSTVQDFTKPVAYTVTAANGTTKSYTVNVTVASNSAKEITAFSILGVNGAIVGTDISVTLPYGTPLTSLVPTIVNTGASVSPASGVAQDFIGPFTYTVTAADNTIKNYTVNVALASNSAKDITTFSIAGVNGAIVGTDISITLPYGTNVKTIIPTIIHTGASISPAIGLAKDFTNPVTYTVAAADNTTKNYTVTVVVANSNIKEITNFSIYGRNGVISGTNISVAVPYDTPSLASLSPSIAYTGVNISPASGVAQDFTNSVTYTVTAADHTTREYLVTVTLAPSDTKNITSFAIPSQISSTIDENSKTIFVAMPYGTDATSLIPAIVYTGVSVSPNTGVAQNFASPVTYIVTAADSSIKAYTVSVAVSALPPLLDAYSGGAAAYSVRKLRMAYTGYAMKVRRSFDNTEQDIGFLSSGALDTASLLNFVGSGNGFISKWYDQSGNGFDVAQATIASQPQIVSSGIVNVVNGRPAVYFNGSQQMSAVSALSVSKMLSVFAVAYFDIGKANYPHICSSGYGANGAYALSLYLATGTPQVWIETNQFHSATAITSGMQYLISNINETGTGNIKVYANDVLNSQFTTTNDLAGVSTYPFALGYNSRDAKYFLIGYLQEVVLFNVSNVSSRANIDADINTYYRIY